MKWYEIAMKVPNRESIYTPTGKTTNKDMANEGTPQIVKVSFDADKVSNPRPVVAYGRGSNCWYIKGD